MVCSRCGRASHRANACFARTSVDGERLESSSSDDDDAYYYERDDEPKYQRRRDTGKRARTTHTPSSRGRAGIYVLRTSSGLYYVGKSNDIDARIAEHRRGAGASCLSGASSSFQVLSNLLTSGSTSDLESWERNETLQRMRAHGIANVRGWMFTSTALSDADYQDAFRQICEKFDLCRRCGRASHFAERCFARNADAWAADMIII